MLKDLRVKDLGQLADLLMRAGHLSDAQKCLDEMQGRLDTLTKQRLDTLAKNVAEQDQYVQPELAPQHLESLSQAAKPEPGMIVDGDGNILAISTQKGERGYDPEAHDKEIAIYCDDVHVPSAHTADVEAGVLQYYEKNAKGRIKTLEKRGKIEIRGNFS